MKSFYWLSLLSLLLLTKAHAQNDPSFFKTIPPIETTTPEWAKTMYGDNPNVFEVDHLFWKYYTAQEFQKNIHTQNYKFWRKHVDPYINEEGYIILPSKKDRVLSVQKLLKRKQQFKSAKSASAGWVNIGPLETYNLSHEGNFPVSWQANIYSFDQSVSNPDILVAGTEAGGVFKSTDRGLHWSLISEDEPFVKGISDVKIAPSNSEIIYVLAGDERKIYKTTNGGDSWAEVWFTNTGGNRFLYVHPTNPDIVFCTTDQGLYKTIDGGVNWNQVLSGNCWDVTAHTAQPSTMYALKSNETLKRCEFFKSTDGGNTWTLKDQGWYMPADVANANDGGARLAVSPAAADWVYAVLIGASKADDNGWIGIYRSKDAGETWTNPRGQDGGPYNSETMPNLASFNPNGSGFHQGFYNLGIAVSHNDANKLWIGCLALSESSDGGATWERIGAYYAGTNDIGWIHPDIQDLHTLGNDVWVCTDGGINYSNDELTTHESRKNGIFASDYWGFGTGWNEDILVGGRYHNGNSGYYQTYGVGNTLRLGGAEAPTGYVNPMDNFTTYFSDINTTVLPTALDGPVQRLAKLAYYPNQHYVESYSSEIEWDPRYANHMYLGKDEKIYKSTDGGVSFEALHSFAASGRVLEIEISRNNPEVMYCVFQEGTYFWNATSIYKTTDGGQSWSKLPDIQASRTRLEISVNPGNENELWVCAPYAANGEKVFRTTDGGSSWDNVSSPLLNDERPRDILFQAGSGGVVYLATNNTVFYYEPASGTWVDYGMGFPLRIYALQMKPFYRDSKLRLASYGRGIWEAPLAVLSKPMAQPMTLTNNVYCSRDTVQFDSYSVLDHENATWEWNFSPVPLYISSTSARNPKVVFGNNGAFDVTLTVRDGNGQSSSQTVSNMVTVDSQCEPEDIPGLALQTINNGDYAQTLPLNILSNTVTMTAWVKPNGIQPDYSGIVMNDGETAGFNFASGNNTLAYHWPGGAWWFNSGLIVPADEWSYVAMVATPDSMTLYVNGQASTHHTSLNEVELSTMKIGSYKGWSGRNYKGLIDEVAVWNRALSQEEIRELRHLTKGHLIPSDTALIAYYQFNETNGSNQVLDRAGMHHALMAGTSNRVMSTAPVGSGVSERQSMTANSGYTFEETGLTLQFQETGQTPQGEIVVSRLSNAPDKAPNTAKDLLLESTYWVVNNYGANTTFDELQYIVFEDIDIPTGNVVHPRSIRLYRRNENAEDTTWNQALDIADEVEKEENGWVKFEEKNQVTSFGQFLLGIGTAPNDKGEDTITALENSTGKIQVSTYPNPVMKGEEIFINYTGTDELRVRIFNSSGKLLKDRIVPSGQRSLSSSGLKTGLYFISIEGNRFIQNKKLIVK
ncbi:LamG-like jellyroll fold domain-containing protein [Rapidithrix thailandica]|uniref:LamG-like jellyroll fold domain-containing protein n=1 Tax=Rapidithrix thailandica TaxID=413964 RepID=A0AAW9S3F1_9BACT